MDYKEYLLKQSAINLSYIAQKMWPTNDNAKSYLSTKLNGNDIKRPWTESDNKKAQKALHDLGLQLINDAPSVVEQAPVKKKVVGAKKETTVKKQGPTKFNLAEELEKVRNKK